MSWGSYDYYYKPYVSVADRRAKAAREMKKLEKKGRTISPVVIEGRQIARTFWGKAWCDHLESYADLRNRLERGRTYVRNGSVCDLQIESGKVTSYVCGSELYEVEIDITRLAAKRWDALRREVGGQVGSLVELLQGRLSSGVMAVMTRRDGGLFPDPREIRMKCSCPDFAFMCKHIAATLYGVGARLDHQPELLFKLRGVDHMELVAGAAADVETIAGGAAGAGGAKTIAADDLADVFGIDLAPVEATQSPPAPRRAAPTKGVRATGPARRKPATKTSAARPRKKAKRKANPRRQPRA
jgi:uncharacterized Zn finger protein